MYSLLKAVPRNKLSRLAGQLAHLKFLPRSFHRQAIRAFIKRYRVDLSEALRTSADDYATFEEFFIRPLKEGARPIEGGVVSPCDGVLSQSSAVPETGLEQVKGQHYSLEALLGSAELAQKFQKGTYATIYLSPSHYHRVHSPVSGQIVETHYIPGDLWPVNAWSVENIPNLFAINERVITVIETPALGTFAVVFVGATIVGHIHLTYFPDISSNVKEDRAVRRQKHQPAFSIAKGAELGFFTLGSTVILLATDALPLTPSVGSEIKMGSTLWA